MRAGRKIVYGSLLMLITPLLTLFQVLQSNDRYYIKWMLIVFATIYASTFDIEGIGDGSRHWQNVYDYYIGLSFPQFWSDLSDIVLFRTNADVNEDVYIHLLSYFTGSVLGLPGLFFTFVGFIYGYFFAGSMTKIFRHFPSWRRHFPFFIISIYFIAIFNLQSLNLVRYSTGFWVLFYATLQYHDTRRIKYLLLLFTAPLFHVGYFALALPVWVVMFLPIRRYWIMVFYFASFSFSIVTPQFAVSQLEKLEVGQEKVRGYYVEEKASIEDRIEREAESRWYRVYKRSGIMQLAVVGIAVVFLLNGDYLNRMNSLESLLFSAGLASKVLSNSTWFLFALSNRSGEIADLFILAAIVIYWQRHYAAGRALKMQPFLQLVLYAAVLFILPVFVYYLSNTIEYLSAYILFLPEIAWFNEELRITIRGLIGELLGI